MKKILLLLFLTGYITTAFAQKVISVEKASDHSTYVKGDDFEGVIFDKEYKRLSNWVDSTLKRFTPTIEDIQLAETILNRQLKDTYKKNLNKYVRSNSAAVHFNLNQYCRQYFGYYDKHGKKIIFLNCFPTGDEQYTRNWKSFLHVGLDGGMAYWRAEINLSEGTLFGFNTNGFA